MAKKTSSERRYVPASKLLFLSAKERLKAHKLPVSKLAKTVIFNKIVTHNVCPECLRTLNNGKCEWHGKPKLQANIPG